jgi:hypothetical protein
MVGPTATSVRRIDSWVVPATKKMKLAAVQWRETRWRAAEMVRTFQVNPNRCAPREGMSPLSANAFRDAGKRRRNETKVALVPTASSPITSHALPALTNEQRWRSIGSCLAPEARIQPRRLYGTDVPDPAIGGGRGGAAVPGTSGRAAEGQKPVA